MIPERAFTLLSVAVAVSLLSLSCGQDELERIAEKPIEARSADEIKTFLLGRWKLGKNRLDGVSISKDSIRIINDKGNVVRGHPWGGKVVFTNQSKIRVNMDSPKGDSTIHIDSFVQNLGESVSVSDGEYITPIKVISRDSIEWWISEEPSSWNDADRYVEPVLIRAEGNPEPPQ